MADESLARIYADRIQQLAVKAELKHWVDVELAEVIGELLRGGDDLRTLVGGMLRVEALALEAPDPRIPDKPTAADQPAGRVSPHGGGRHRAAGLAAVPA